MLSPRDAGTSYRQQVRDELRRAIDSESVCCGVIGLGFIGSVLMNALIEAGLTARGYDRIPRAVLRFCEARRATIQSSAQHRPYACGADVETLRNCNVLFVAVRNLVDKSGIDDEPLRSAARLVARHSIRPLLVILESTVSPGTTRRFAEEIGAAGQDDGIFVAHAPERLSAGQDHVTLRSTPHLVAGMDDDAASLASAMLRKICDTVIPVSSPEVSELSKLLENAFLSVNIGLTSEVTRLSASLGIRAHEVCQAAATKPRGFMPFYPGAGLGGHCLPNDLFMLAEAARTRGWEPELLNGAIAVNDRAPQIAVDRLSALLCADGSTLDGSRILVIGVGFKTGSPDTTRSPAIDVVRILRSRGASVCYVDTSIAGFQVDGLPVIQIRPDEVPSGRFTAGLILSGELSLPEDSLLEGCRVLLDAGGSRANRARVAGMETL